MTIENGSSSKIAADQLDGDVGGAGDGDPQAGQVVVVAGRGGRGSPGRSSARPGSTVTRSAATRASTRSTSNTGSGSIVAPAATDARIPALSPNMWKYGFTIR